MKEDRIDNCPNCKCKTDQIQEKFDPDADEENMLWVWTCKECKESIELV